MNRTTLPTLAALAALAACTHDRTRATHAAEPAAPRPVAALEDGHVSREELDVATHDLQASLTRLAALELLDVGALIHDQPDGAMNCYGPCEDDPRAQAWMQAHVTKIDRFHALVDDAEALARSKTSQTSAEVQAAVAAIAALQLVEIEVRGK